MSGRSSPIPSPLGYVAHELHGPERAWTETNCYADVWIEILHGYGLDPAASLGMVFAMDYGGDQWTFFKQSHHDLYTLYGLDVQELMLWKTLAENAQEQLALGRLVLVEADAFYLPDTAGTDYQTHHVKTTIGIQRIDADGKALDYFHGPGFHRLQGADFDKTFRVHAPHDPTYMPFFCELVRFDAMVKREARELASLAKAALVRHLARRPKVNPFATYRPRLMADVPWIREGGMERYHAYAFATLRQVGAAFELGAYHLRFLAKHETGNFAAAATDADAISETCKSMLLKLARAVMSPKPVDFGPMLDELEARWTRLNTALDMAMR